jgi:hypothetical protein
MANATGPFGLRPVRHKNGSPWNGACVPVYCSASYAADMFIGDPLVASLVNAEMDATGHYESVNVSAATDGIVISGVIVAFAPNPSNLELNYRPSETERIAYACMDQTVIYQIRDNAGGTPIDNWVGYNAVCIDTTGSAITGLSGFMLSGTTLVSENQSYPLLIEGLANIEDNELGDDAIWDVSLNTFFNTTGLVLGVSTTS